MISLKTHVIIVAGGSGKRMSSVVPKQFLALSGIPILIRTIQKFTETLPKVRVIVVLPKDYIPFWSALCEKNNFKISHDIAEGGQERFHSVKNGLNMIEQEGIVAIHDAVRPMVDKQVILEGFKLAAIKGTAVPFVNSVESVRIITGPSNKSIDRTNVAFIQTPQCFKTEIIKAAYKQPYKSSFTDDASVVESNGIPIFLYNGNRENIKITSGDDLIFAESLLKKKG